MKTWEWYAGEDDETVGVGPCATRQDAIDEAVRCGFGLDVDKSNGVRSYSFTVLEATKAPVELSSCVDFDCFIESLTERVDENHGDVAEAGSIFDTDQWNSDQARDLQAMIEATVAAWQAKHSIVIEPWLFTATRNQETVKVERKIEPEPAS